METQKFVIVNAGSNIRWTGRKVTGAHNGAIAIKEGSLDYRNGQLVGGTFVMDTTSISVLDVTDPSTNAQFVGHLASDDFFSAAQYPTAVFEMASATKKSETLYGITGNLTIKGITHPLNFEAHVILSGQSVNVMCKIVVNRTLYDMKFRSGNFFQNLGDTMIYNDFELNVNIAAKAVPSAVLV